MILEFKVKNYRSFKGEVKFSMLADAARAKSGNYFEILEDGGKKEIRILKTAVIYGANASGKSNLIKALNELIRFILYKPKVKDQLKLDDPFSFEKNNSEMDSEFSLTFLGSAHVKYNYLIKIFKNQVVHEKLDYYPDGRIKNLITRDRSNINLIKTSSEDDKEEIIEVIKFEDKEYKIFRNQLFLSSFAQDAHDVLTGVYMYFQNNFQHSNEEYSSEDAVSKQLFFDKILKNQLAGLLGAADTKIKGFEVKRFKDVIANLRIDLPNYNEETFNDWYLTSTLHDTYENDVLQDSKGALSLINESQGSQTLYRLGARILKAIKEGKILIYDELDTSLHSFVTKMLVMLFLSSKINKKNAQLIFTTHDISLLDKDLLRKDQIWFAEKDEKGASDLYSLQDFDGLREDIPFDKWYMAGKFGGLPNIGEIESIFGE